VIGGIVGHQNDETPEGIVIGGLVGAVAGGLMGKARDQQVNRERYYQNQIYQQQTQINQMSRPCVTVNDVITMSRNGLGEQVIINYLNANGVDRQLTVSEIISLHQQGVSENVIAAMQRAPVGGPVARTAVASPTYVTPAPSTVIVHEQYRVVPPPTTIIYRSGPPVHHWHHGPYHRW
jgi:hypothetical protein